MTRLIIGAALAASSLSMVVQHPLFRNVFQLITQRYKPPTIRAPAIQARGFTILLQPRSQNRHSPLPRLIILREKSLQTPPVGREDQQVVRAVAFSEQVLGGLIPKGQLRPHRPQAWQRQREKIRRAGPTYLIDVYVCLASDRDRDGKAFDSSPTCWT